MSLGNPYLASLDKTEKDSLSANPLENSSIAHTIISKPCTFEEAFQGRGFCSL